MHWKLGHFQNVHFFSLLAMQKKLKNLSIELTKYQITQQKNIYSRVAKFLKYLERVAIQNKFENPWHNILILM
jgi:hypothetical protein